MKNSFIAIGHIVNDTEPSNHLGGGVSYSAITAARLGYDAHIITKCPQDHPYIQELNNYGVRVHRLPSDKNTITSFRNVYDSNGKRTQTVLGQQEMIHLHDFEFFPHNILKNATILVATVIGEVDVSLFPHLAQYGTVTITPQGYYRKIDKNGKVHQYKWSNVENYLDYAKIVVLSNEDLTLKNRFDNTAFHNVLSHVKITALTQGEKGSTIYSEENPVFRTDSFHLSRQETKDLTGAGDTYAAAFITEYMHTKNIKKSAQFATLYAALKIMGIHGIGIESIPTRRQYKSFIMKDKERVTDFYRLQTSQI